MAPPTKHDDDKNPASPAPARRRTKVLHLSCRANPARGGVERPAVTLRHLGADQIQSDLLRRYYRSSKRRRLHACFLEVLKLTMAAKRRASSSESMSRVPGSTEDGLAAMMAQLSTMTATTSAGGERAATAPATASTTSSPPADQSSGIGEMFQKMAVSSDE